LGNIELLNSCIGFISWTDISLSPFFTDLFM